MSTTTSTKKIEWFWGKRKLSPSISTFRASDTQNLRENKEYFIPYNCYVSLYRLIIEDNLMPITTSDRLKRNIPEIMNIWEKRANIEIKAAHHQDKFSLRDALPDYLSQLAKALSNTTDRTSARKKYEKEETTRISEEHGKDRAGSFNYTINQLIQEYHILRQIICDVLEDEAPLSYIEREVIVCSIEQAVNDAATKFSDTLNERTPGFKDQGEIQEVTFRDLLKALNESSIMAFTDVKGNITYVNDKFCEISKYSREELLGQNHRLIKSGHHSHEFYVSLWEKIAAGKVWTGDIKNRAKDGSYYWVYTSIIPFLDIQGKPFQYAAIRVDITERKKTEEENEKVIGERNNARLEHEVYEKFVATLAHDLRTPMSVALMTAELIQRNPEVHDTVKRLAERIKIKLQQSDEMIKDVLDANRIKNEFKISLEVECDVGEVINSALKDLKVIHGDRFIFKSSQSFKGHWSISGIRRIVENLCSNAIKYGNSNSPVTINLDENSGRLELSVHNTGKPLLKMEILKIFDYLHQAPFAEVSRQKGWGIGLAVVRGLVEAEGGTVEVKSNLEEGTTFTVSLPMDARLLCSLV